MPDFEALQTRLGWTFREVQWLQLALTHPSVAHEQGFEGQHNQRLEFLGDAVLGVVLTRELYDRFPAFGEGPLTKARAHLVNRRSLAERARRLDLGSSLILSAGEEASGGRQRPSALADAFEAMIGAVFFDGGYEAAKAVVLRCFEDSWRGFDAIPKVENPKGELQELLQAQSPVAPRYLVTSASGPDHDRIFECAVHHAGVELGRGRGKSKKHAESEAALAALHRLRETVGPPDAMALPHPDPIPTMNGKQRVLARLAGQPVDRLPLMPITMMFAAVQSGVKYRDYVTDHRVLVRAQLETADKFGFDYVSVISDPAREAADCGAKVEFFDDQPPAIVEDQARLADKTELARLRMPDPLAGGRMLDRVRGVALFKERTADQKLIEGWVEGPCAEAADLRGINTLMLDFFDDAAFVRDLFEFVIEMELRFAKAQVEAGADIIGVGDAAASLVGPQIYEEFVWPYEKRLVEGLHRLGTRARLHICGNTRGILEGMGRLGCEIVDLDFPSPISEARSKMGPGQVLLGNINPVRVLRDGTAESVREAVADCHRQAGPAFIVGAGCEVPRDTRPENVFAMRDYAWEHR